ncbi:bifunctional folylpolyglutamate synthase/dihydrofolate synthase [Rhizomonospora bruguierae]|uniref:bifunctional folylpolyglutamate synthase/dihydrofolate synthase n=1 Tax=Rhizomonospora bruguierae TaxID=1581705 RepID=UPI001BD02584|nr:hypothetical protein [Micromonospora sp. NBRC 107566]
MRQPVTGSFADRLERMGRLLEAVGAPHRRLWTLHVAGTSGKTSVCYFLRSLLVRSGWTPGLSVSPHVGAVTDRVQVGAGPIDPDTFLRELTAFLDAVPHRVRGAVNFLDVMTAFAWWVFDRVGVQRAVVEVGVGGLHDRSNLLPAEGKVCVIGDVGLDHVGRLGHSLAEVAVHKAGIIKQGCHVVALRQHPVVESVISATAAGREATVEYVDGALSPPCDLPDFQRRNWALALAAYRHVARLHAMPELNGADLAAAAWDQPPGRMERWCLAGRELLLDGAHNPQKMAGLRKSLAHHGPAGLTVVANMVRTSGDRVAETCSELARIDGVRLIVPRFRLAPVPVKQSLSPVGFATLARAAGVPSAECVEDLAEAVRRAVAAPRPVVVTGSLYLVSQVRHLLAAWGGRPAERRR